MDDWPNIFLTVLMGVLALSSAPVLSTILLKVLRKDGLQVDATNFSRSHKECSAAWAFFFFMAILLIAFTEESSVSEKVSDAFAYFLTANGMVAVIFLIFLLFRKHVSQNESRTSSTKLPLQFPLDFFLASNIIWLGIIGRLLSDLFFDS